MDRDLSGQTATRESKIDEIGISNGDEIKEIIEQIQGCEYKGTNESHSCHVITVIPRNIHEIQHRLYQNGVKVEFNIPLETKNEILENIEIDKFSVGIVRFENV